MPFLRLALSDNHQLCNRFNFFALFSFRGNSHMKQNWGHFQQSVLQWPILHGMETICAEWLSSDPPGPRPALAATPGHPPAAPPCSAGTGHGAWAPPPASTWRAGGWALCHTAQHAVKTPLINQHPACRGQHSPICIMHQRNEIPLPVQSRPPTLRRGLGNWVGGCYSIQRLFVGKWDLPAQPLRKSLRQRSGPLLHLP